MLRVFVFAQTDSIPIGRIIYFQNASTHGDLPQNGYATLLFNARNSIYIHNGIQSGDTLIQDPDFSFPIHIAGDQEGFPILKMHDSRKIYFKIECRQTPEHCILTDTLGGIQWELLPERKKIGNLEARRAKGDFRGRTYLVWYTLEIPIPSGPFKLGGLPGLILEAETTDSQVRFLFRQLEISPKLPARIFMPSGKNLKISFKDFLKSESAFFKNLEKEYQAQGIDMHVARDVFIELTADQ